MILVTKSNVFISICMLAVFQVASAIANGAPDRATVDEEQIELPPEIVDRIAHLEERIASLEAVEARVAELEELLTHVTVVPTAINGLIGPHLIIQGCNVHIRNGAGVTTAHNGLGNLLIGYNESDGDGDGDGDAFRKGSHNLVIGAGHDFTKDSGIVSGENNAITGIAATAIGGFGNKAAGDYSSVSGGSGTVVSRNYSSVLGESTDVQDRNADVGNGETENSLLPPYIAGPDGSTGAAGTREDPFDLRAALDGTEAIPEGETLYLLPGIYDDPQPGVTGAYLDRRFSVAMSDIVIKPLSDPYTAEIRGGFYIESESNNVTVENILFVNPDPIPGGEPTLEGSPYPGARLPGKPYTPREFQDWGAVGVTVGGGSGHRIVNNAAYGGAQSYTSFQATNVEINGNVAYNMGWTGADRVHGHALYIQNPSGRVIDRLIVKNNLFSTSARSRFNNGQYALHVFKTSGNLQNISVVENGIKGSSVVRSDDFSVDDVRFTNNVLEEINHPRAPGENGREFSFGNPANVDGSVLHADNIYVDGMVSLVNNRFSQLVSVRTTVIKTEREWWRGGMRGPPGDLFMEEGTFVDLSISGGDDLFRIWMNDYDVNRANVVVLDLDRNGVVNIDAFGLLEAGDEYNVRHYMDVGTVAFTGVYDGKAIILPIIENSDDRMDMFVLFKS